MNSSQAKVKILNIEFDNLTCQELLKQFQEGLLVTPNIDHLIKLQHHQGFYDCYQQASFAVCDSRIIYLLMKVLFPNSALKEQITGSDFFPAFCQHHATQKSDVRIFLLGGTEESVVRAAENINRKTNSTIVTGYYSPPFGFERSPEENAKIFSAIRDSGANTLAIGVGAPKQELWVCEHRHNIPSIKKFLAIGATIEFESGHLKRSPKWMTKLGIEWFYRMCQEPKRLAKRYLVEDLPFFLLLLKQRLGLYKNPWQ
jgi:N-acetylglucosaminyldiphosphoundecaprenol N-acetyl-beta-D-mannosaminyltransferase